MRVLALDIASTTGVCFDDPERENVPVFRTWALSRTGGPGEWGPRFRDLHYRLDCLFYELAVGKGSPEIMAFEEPLNVMRRAMHGAKMNNNTTRLLIGLAAIAEERAVAYGLRPYEVPVSTAKAHFGGKTTDSDPKAAVMARCRQLGWAVKNQDEADSASIWAFTKARLDPKFSYQTTPLFARR